MPNTPVPHGYSKVQIFFTDGLSADVLSCQKCGALVLMSKTHDSWHKKNG